MTDDSVLDPAAIARLHRLGGDRLVRQMIELYLGQAPSRIAALKDSVSADDAHGVERAAHTLKSTAGNLGATRVQHTSEAMESLAADGTIDRQLAVRLLQEFDESAAELRTRLEELE